MLSESEDSVDADSTDVPVGSVAEGEEDVWSEADSDTSVVVRRSLWDTAATDRHKMNHKPALPIHCDDCMIAKAKRKRRVSRHAPKTALRFGDSVTCDHVFMKDWMGNKGVDGVPDTFNVLDIATRCMYSFPVHSKDALDTFTAINRMKGRAKIKHMYSDNFSAIKKAVKLLGINWESCLPGVHHNNAIIELCNQEILNDTSVLLLSLIHI